MPRVDMGGVWIILTLVGCAACYLLACYEDKRQAREREEMRRHVGQHVRGESDERGA